MDVHLNIITSPWRFSWRLGALTVTLTAAASLRDSFLSAWSFPFGGLPPFSCLFLSWRPCQSRSLIPSLAPSWWWPCPLLRWALLTLSGYALSVPSAFSLRRSRWLIPSHCRPSCAVFMLMVSVIGAHFALAEGRLPMRLVLSEPLGSCGGSTYIALDWTWLVSANLPGAIGAQVGVSYFTARRSARIHGDHFVSFPDFCLSLTRHSHRVMFLGHLQDEWLGWLTVPLLAFPGLCHLHWLIVTTVWSWCILR